MPRAPKISTLKKKLDKVHSYYVRLRDTDSDGYGDCISCGTTLEWSQGQNGHFRPRQHLSTRWEDTNTHLQCSRCNCWGGGESYLYALELDRRYYEGKADELVAQSREFKKFMVFEYQELIAEYTEKCKELLKDKSFDLKL